MHQTITYQKRSFSILPRDSDCIQILAMKEGKQVWWYLMRDIQNLLQTDLIEY